jgi:peptidoglycan/LPS O-acetylase OafA/YrhL
MRPLRSTQRADAPATRPGAETTKGFRLDIQGVRGLALVLVLCTHAEIPHATGGFIGLDIFFVLSGYLITGLILGEIKRSGRVSLLNFYARRAKRILPHVAVVLAAVVVASLVLFSPTRSFRVSHDVIAAGAYFINWRFIAESVDYFAFNGAGISPLQHFWSLSVEEQFYLLWPALFLLVALGARRLRWQPRRALWLVVAPLGLASFVYGVRYTHMNPDAAYFSTFSRGWELAIGGALALALPRRGLHMPRLLPPLLAALGLAVLIGMTVTFSNSTPYPGWWGLLPTLATVAIIVAGNAVRLASPLRLLTNPPMQYLGKISYAVYLWHWPFLVFAAAEFGDLSWHKRVVVTLASFIPALVTHYLVEERFRRSKRLNLMPRRAVALGLSCTAAAIALGGVLSLAQPTIPEAEASTVLGAKAVDDHKPLQRRARAIRPTPRNAVQDRGYFFKDGCQLKNNPIRHSPGKACVLDFRRKPRSSGITAVMVGDSHGMMYAPAMINIAQRHHWRLINLTRAGCTDADVDYHPGCDGWRANIMRRIRRAHPNLVVVSNATYSAYKVIVHGKKLTRYKSEPYLIRGFARTLRRWQRMGAKVAVIRDIAQAPFDPPDCVSDHRNNLRKCAFRPHRRKLNFPTRAAHRVPGVTLIDPLPELCPHKLCASVIGNALVYRNDYHLSATFAHTLGPWLRRHLPRVLARRNAAKASNATARTDPCRNRRAHG